MSSISAEIPSPGRDLWPRVGWGFLLLGAILAAGNAFLFATVSGYLDPVQKSRMFAIPLVGFAHTFGGAIASLIGPFQFSGSVAQASSALACLAGAQLPHLRRGQRACRPVPLTGERGTQHIWNCFHRAGARVAVHRGESVFHDSGTAG